MMRSCHLRVGHFRSHWGWFRGTQPQYPCQQPHHLRTHFSLCVVGMSFLLLVNCFLLLTATMIKADHEKATIKQDQPFSIIRFIKTTMFDQTLINHCQQSGYIKHYQPPVASGMLLGTLAQARAASSSCSQARLLRLRPSKFHEAWRCNQPRGRKTHVSFWFIKLVCGFKHVWFFHNI